MSERTHINTSLYFLSVLDMMYCRAAASIATTMLSKTLIVFLLMYLLSDFSYAQRDKKFFRNDYTYLEAVEGFYKFHPSLRTWADAKRICALEGASLYYPENGEEANAVLSFWNKTNPSLAWIYVGMSDLMIEGIFETVDGRFVSELYTSWKTGQPENGGGNENCGCLNYGEMHDCACHLKLPSICKKSLLSLEWNYNCNTSYLDYTFNEDTGKCYKLHTTPLNWAEAYAVCRAEQSHLAVINHRREAESLANFTVPSLEKRVVGNYFRGIYHLGFHNRLQAGWQTVRGAPMTVDDDAWWDNHQPIIDEHEQCGSMFFNGRLNSISCDTKSFFICEHEGGSSNLEQEELYQ